MCSANWYTLKIDNIIPRNLVFVLLRYCCLFVFVDLFSFVVFDIDDDLDVTPP